MKNICFDQIAHEGKIGPDSEPESSGSHLSVPLYQSQSACRSKNVFGFSLLAGCRLHSNAILPIKYPPVPVISPPPPPDITARIDGTTSMQYPDGVPQNPGRKVTSPKMNPVTIKTPPITSIAIFSEAVLPSRAPTKFALCRFLVRSRYASCVRASQPSQNSKNEVYPHQVVGASNQNALFPKGNPRVAATHKYASMRTPAMEMVVKG